jgi:hypothetical protein
MRPATKQLIISGVVIVAIGVVAVMLFTLSKSGVDRAPPGDMAPPPPPTLPSTLLAAIDRILENLELANIAFNAPATLQLGNSAVVQLLLSTQKSIEELQNMITATGEKEGARIRVSNQMEARLSGLGFKIETVTPEVQAVSATNVTEWKWEIEPTEPGSQRLHLTLSAQLHVEGQRVPRTIRTFERTIEVHVTWSQKVSHFVANNWQWLWTTILIPIAGWIIRKRKQRDASSARKDTT